MSSDYTIKKNRRTYNILHFLLEQRTPKQFSYYKLQLVAL